jgi:hypothetical protein
VDLQLNGRGGGSNDMVEKDLLPGGKEESTKTVKEDLLPYSEEEQ